MNACVYVYIRMCVCVYACLRFLCVCGYVCMNVSVYYNIIMALYVCMYVGMEVLLICKYSQVPFS